MDPDRTLELLIDAAVKGDAEKMIESAEDLYRWLTKGGYPPQEPRESED